MIGLFPVKETASGDVKMNLFDLKFLAYNLIFNIANVILFYSLMQFYNFQTIGPFEISKVVFYFLIIGVNTTFPISLGFMATNVGSLAIDLQYKVDIQLHFNFSNTIQVIIEDQKYSLKKIRSE